jgi:hypothetical protein
MRETEGMTMAATSGAHGPVPHGPPEGYGPPPNSAPAGPPSNFSGPPQAARAPIGPPPPRPSGNMTSPPGPVAQQSGGFLGVLVDANSDTIVTPGLIKFFGLLTVLMISAQCTLFFALGLWISSWDNGWAWGIIMMVAAPFVWLFETLLLRLFLASVVARIKTTEYLKLIKDKL